MACWSTWEPSATTCTCVSLAVQQAYLAAAKKTGVEIASLALGEMNNVPLKSDPTRNNWLVDSVAVMKALNVKIVLVAAFSKGDLLGDKAGIDHTVEILKKHAPPPRRQA